ncbi:MAG: Trk system potassium transporter TrkA [Acidimicrobiia bacterium]|nr:Trk system potassium transporter TrkA [Acidimicrobiia bacterium]
MRIIIVGAGAVGSYLAERLSTEGQDVVVIEVDSRRAAELQDQLDALVITGNGASQTVLKEAEVDRADLFIAVSSNDGANILASHAASAMGVKRTVARVEDPGLRQGLTDLDVDVVIDPGESAAGEIQTLLGESGVSELIEFARGQLVLVGGIVQDGSPLLSKSASLSDLRTTMDSFDWVVTAVVRGGRTIVAHGETEISAGDHVLIMVREQDLDWAKEMIGLHSRKIRRAIVLGTTRVAELTADLLESQGMQVVIIDPDQARCRVAAERHQGALVVAGDPTDPALLDELDIADDDAVVALTSSDEVNIVASLVAKAMGAATTISRVNRLSYVGLLSGFGIDATVSVRLAAANSILRFVRRGRIHSVATFNDTDAEAIEIEVEASSRSVGQTLLDLPLPPGAVIGGILREGDVFVPTGRTEIRARDHLIIFALPAALPSVESLFSQ